MHPGAPGEWFQFALADPRSDEHVGDVGLGAVADARNDACIALLERIGMRRTSTEHVRFKGEWCDERTYELRRDEG